MKILVDVSHPAHVHFFRFAIGEWERLGHQVRIVARDKDLTLPLLEEYGFSYDCLSSMREGVLGLALELVEHEARLLRFARRFRPDVMLNVGGTFIVHVAKLLGIRSIVFSDTENATLSNRITYPFADEICTPSCYRVDLGKNQVLYDGYQELAYLHPRYFTPDPQVLKEAGLHPDQRLFLIRFVSWGAAHDVGHNGFSLEGKRHLVQQLDVLGRVIITSEATLPAEFDPYRMSIPPTKVHDLLHYSSLYIGEGGTMAAEAALLGTPNIRVSTRTAGTHEEREQKYQIGYRIPDEGEAIAMAVELARDPKIREDFQKKRDAMLADKIDVTAWMVRFVENTCERSSPC
jgi:predicted glycosyltransferase